MREGLGVGRGEEGKTGEKSLDGAEEGVVLWGEGRQVWGGRGEG